MGQPLTALRADGGASSNAFLMQLQADLLGRPLLQSRVEEVGALGAAAMAFGALGIAMPLDTTPPTVFTPRQSMGDLRALWVQAVARARG